MPRPVSTAEFGHRLLCPRAYAPTWSVVAASRERRAHRNPRRGTTKHLLAKGQQAPLCQPDSEIRRPPSSSRPVTVGYLVQLAWRGSIGGAVLTPLRGGQRPVGVGSSTKWSEQESSLAEEGELAQSHNAVQSAQRRRSKAGGVPLGDAGPSILWAHGSSQRPPVQSVTGVLTAAAQQQHQGLQPQRLFVRLRSCRHFKSLHRLSKLPSSRNHRCMHLEGGESPDELDTSSVSQDPRRPPSVRVGRTLNGRMVWRRGSLGVRDG